MVLCLFSLSTERDHFIFEIGYNGKWEKFSDVSVVRVFHRHSWRRPVLVNFCGKTNIRYIWHYLGKTRLLVLVAGVAFMEIAFMLVRGLNNKVVCLEFNWKMLERFREKVRWTKNLLVYAKCSANLMSTLWSILEPEKLQQTWKLSHKYFIQKCKPVFEKTTHWKTNTYLMLLSVNICVENIGNFNKTLCVESISSLVLGWKPSHAILYKDFSHTDAQTVFSNAAHWKSMRLSHACS